MSDDEISKILDHMLTAQEAILENLVKLKAEFDYYDNLGKEYEEAAAADTTAPEPVTSVEIALTDIRAMMAEKSAAGFGQQCREIITSFGADKLSALDPKFYEEAMKKVEALGNA